MERKDDGGLMIAPWFDLLCIRCTIGGGRKLVYDYMKLGLEALGAIWQLTRPSCEEKTEL